MLPPLTLNLAVKAKESKTLQFFKAFVTVNLLMPFAEKVEHISYAYKPQRYSNAVY